MIQFNLFMLGFADFYEIRLEDYIKRVMTSLRDTHTEIELDRFAETTARIFKTSPEEVLRLVGEYDLRGVIKK